MDKGSTTYHFPSLSFKDKGLEKAFGPYYFRVNQRHDRLCYLLAILFYMGDGIRDFILFPDHLPLLVSVRYGVVVPMFVVGFVFSVVKHELYAQIWQYLYAVYFFVTGIGALVIAKIIPPPLGPTLYVALIYCLIFGYTFIRLRFVYATAVGLTLTLIYLVCVLVFAPFDRALTWVQLPFVMGVNVLGMFVAYTMEKNFRHHFFLETRYMDKNDELDKLNKSLEYRVSTRTAELENANKILKQNMDELKTSEAERYKLESQLRQAYKMEAIGTLAGGIAHDFNNILSAILGFTELAMDDAKENHDVRENLSEVFRAGTRARDLVRQILAFARQSDEERKPIQISPIAKEVLKLLGPTLPSNIDIESDIESDLFITADPVNVHQILMNLCTNAGHAMKHGGRLTISLKDMFLSSDTIPESMDLASGDHVVLRVSDTGNGIKPDIMDSIFEPYFTTKGPGEGTGMGLAMVYGIMKNYGGDIEVKSRPEMGTTFTLYFPAQRRVVDEDAYVQEDLPGGHERILFIDDEPVIAKMNSRILESLGYDVTKRVSSLEALSLFEAKSDAFDLVITDMMMPGMTGDRLATEIMRIRSDLPVILCTGYSKTITEESVAAIGIKSLIYKPVIKADLARVVRRVLDESV